MTSDKNAVIRLEKLCFLIVVSSKRMMKKLMENIPKLRENKNLK